MLKVVVENRGEHEKKMKKNKSKKKEKKKEKKKAVVCPPPPPLINHLLCLLMVVHRLNLLSRWHPEGLMEFAGDDTSSASCYWNFKGPQNPCRRRRSLACLLCFLANKAVVVARNF